MSTNSKQCTKCGEVKPLTDFNRNRQSRDGRRPDCSACQSKRKNPMGNRGGPRALDLTGQVFGRLTVLRRVQNDKQGKAVWLCRCECGQEIAVRRGSLRNGGTRSCRCLQRESAIHRGIEAAKSGGSGGLFRRLPYGQAAKNDLLATYKRTSRQRGYEYTLPDHLAIQLFSQPCHYCGAEPAQAVAMGKYDDGFRYNGIDRADNSQGYTPDNVVSCCGTCNRMKGTQGYEEFLEQVHIIAENHKGESWQSVA